MGAGWIDWQEGNDTLGPERGQGVVLSCYVTDLGRIEVRGVPIAEVACAFKPHETDDRATDAGGQFLPLQKNMKTRTILSV